MSLSEARVLFSIVAWRVPFVLDLQPLLFADLCAGHSDSQQMARGVVLMVLSLSLRDLVQHLMCLVSCKYFEENSLLTGAC